MTYDPFIDINKLINDMLEADYPSTKIDVVVENQEDWEYVWIQDSDGRKIMAVF